MDSIFGDAEPQFALYSNVETIVHLDNTVITKDETTVKKIINESEIDANRSFVFLGEYRELEVVINLFLYDNPQAKMNEIYSYLNAQIAFWKHRDGLPFQNNEGDNLPFIIGEVIPFNVDTFDFSDKLLIKFLQSTGMDLCIQTESGLNIQTEDGQTIRKE